MQNHYPERLGAVSEVLMSSFLGTTRTAHGAEYYSLLCDHTVHSAAAW